MPTIERPTLHVYFGQKTAVVCASTVMPVGKSATLFLLSTLNAWVRRHVFTGSSTMAERSYDTNMRLMHEAITRGDVDGLKVLWKATLTLLLRDLGADRLYFRFRVGVGEEESYQLLLEPFDQGVDAGMTLVFDTFSRRVGPHGRHNGDHRFPRNMLAAPLPPPPPPDAYSMLLGDD